MPPAHVRVRHIVEEPGHRGGHQRELEHVQHEPHAAGQALHDALRRRERVRRHREAHAERERPERDGGPVDEHALRDRPRRAHAPDGIERAVDRQHQRDRRQHEHDEADAAEALRLGGELVERRQHRARDGVGHERLQEVLLERDCETPPNIGNAENTASITVSSGTSAISVVKVRLLAVRPSRSSRKRSRSVRSVSSQGQFDSACASCAARSRQLGLQGIVNRHGNYDMGPCGMARACLRRPHAHPARSQSTPQPQRRGHRPARADRARPGLGARGSPPPATARWRSRCCRWPSRSRAC